MHDFSIFFQGLAMGAGLIVAIGAQNAFVLTQAIEHNHGLAVAATCAIIDALLILAGVSGMGTLVAQNEILRAAAALGGSAFLFWFGTRSFLNALRPETLAAGSSVNRKLWPTLSATLAVSLLNPHVYLDTVVMLGAISGNYPGNGRWVFGAGAALMSQIWFFSLCFAGHKLAPVFRSPRAWQWLHGLVGIMVFWVGGNLLLEWIKAFYE